MVNQDTKTPIELFGRRILYTSETAIDERNLIKVLNKVLPIFELNKMESNYLYNYRRGRQPILNRIKKVRPEINNKIVENHALEIVDFKKGYVFGEPVQYIRRGANRNGDDSENETNKISTKIATLNEYMFEADKAAKDIELAEWFYTCGTAYRMILPSGEQTAPFEIDIPDPRFTAIVYSRTFGKKPVMSFQEIMTDDEKKIYAIYTPTHYYEVENNKIVKSEPHILCDIPIVEYPADRSRLGAFEIVIGLLDAINTTSSNRIDGIEQFIQAFMKFVNCKIDQKSLDELAELGALQFSSDPSCPADVDIISSQLNQTEVQITTEHLYQMILIICGMPDRNGSNRSTGDTGQAVILRDGWSAAESRARENELIFKSSEKQFLKLVLKILKDTNNLELNLSDIDIKFTRNKTDNLLTKTQGLQNMLEAGINPQIAINTVGLFSDPEQVYLDSLDYLKKWLNIEAKTTPSNNKSTDTKKLEG